MRYSRCGSRRRSAYADLRRIRHCKSHKRRPNEEHTAKIQEDTPRARGRFSFPGREMGCVVLWCGRERPRKRVFFSGRNHGVTEKGGGICVSEQFCGSEADGANVERRIEEEYGLANGGGGGMN